MGALAVVGIFVALAVMTVLIYKGLHPAIATILCVLIVLVTNGMNIGETMSSA